MQDNKLRFFFWQFMPNIHESGYIKALSNAGYECTVVYQSSIPNERILLGVESPDYGSAEIIYCPPESDLPEFTNFANENDIHLFTGIYAFDLTHRAFASLQASSALLVIISESRRVTGFKGLIRFFDSWMFESSIRQRIDGVLAMGDLGIHWFNITGYRKEIIYPFCYSLNSINNSSINQKSDGKIHLAFAGSFDARKDPLIILKALSNFNCKNIVMHWFGDGPLAAELKFRIDHCTNGCEHIIHGSVINSIFRTLLQTIDIFILPSLWDGWGAVVNEAALAGCRLIISDHCGAASICSGRQGGMFKAGDFENLSDHLYELIGCGPITEVERNANIEWARCINGESAARYLLAVIANLKGEGDRPNAMWISDLSVEPTTHKKKQKLIVAYHFLPNYRKGIFDEINDKYDATFYGENVNNFDGIPVASLAKTYKFKKISNYRLGQLWFQPMILSAALFKNYDAIIYLANPHFVTTWLAAFISKIRGKKIIFWGHGFNNDRLNLANKGKKIFFSIADAIYLYGFNAKLYAINLGIPENKLYVGFNSLDYKKQIVIRNLLLKQFDNFKANEVLNILCISRLTKLCRYDLLFDALLLAKKNFNFSAIVNIIGDGPEKKSLETLARSHGIHVNFLGALYDDEVVARHIFVTDVIVSPGKIGLTAMHSLMFGTPVISHNEIYSQMPEFEAIIEGITGALFIKNNAESLAATLINFRSKFHNRQTSQSACFLMIDKLYNPQNQMIIMQKAIDGIEPDIGNDANKIFLQSN